jgi:V8-like Glu-specific endopeptidase
MRDVYYLFPIIVFFSIPLPIEDRGEYRGLKNSWAQIPSRSLAGLHYLFKGHELDDEKGLVKVTGPVVEITNGEKLGAKVHRNGFVTEMDSDDFEQQQELGRSVFEARTGTGNNVGTAFLVGNNIVLTNRHVMGLSPGSRQWPCGMFSIRLNHRDERVSCKKVRYCSHRYDYCVVEMNKLESGDPIGSEVRPLRLTRKIKEDKDIILLHIGNAAGLGIQASRGQGVKLRQGEFIHFAPTLGGSSGAPLFNEKGEVIGINWGHSGVNFIDDTAYNQGVLSQTIYQELAKTHQHTLKEIKSFRSWYHRSHSHRQVKVETVD